MSQPDFYLASTEGYDLEEPRACYRIKRLQGKYRDDLLLIKIHPVLELNGNEYGLPFNTLEKLIVASRHENSSLFPVNEWPVFVYVMAVLVDNPEQLITISDEQIKLIAWAELYKNLTDATASVSSRRK